MYRGAEVAEYTCGYFASSWSPLLFIAPEEYLSYGIGGVHNLTTKPIDPNTSRKEYKIQDHLGNTRVVLDGTGTIAGRYDYEPFGGVLWQSAPTPRLSFIDKEKDKETNLSNFGARNYDDRLGRFMSVDALWEKYRAYSPYNYAGNNPLLLRDPSGFGWFGDLLSNTSQKALNLLEKGRQRIVNSFSASIAVSKAILGLELKSQLGPVKLEGKAKIGNVGMAVKQSAEGATVKINAEGLTGGVEGSFGSAKANVGATIAQAEIEIGEKGVTGAVSGGGFNAGAEVGKEGVTINNSGVIAIGGDVALDGIGVSGSVSWNIIETLIGGIEMGQGIFQMIFDNTIGVIEEDMKDASMVE